MTRARRPISTYLLLAALSGLCACGTTNQALEARQGYRIVSPNTETETTTVAILENSHTVSSPYNVRYTLAAELPAGTYVLKGRDESGRYFESDFAWRRITLTYVGLTLYGGPKKESLRGGVYVDNSGGNYVYWFWEGDVAPVRVPAPALKVELRTEVDSDAVAMRRQREDVERLRREDEEKSRKAREAKDALARALAAARTRDRVACASTADCDRAFAWAQQYLLGISDMRIQVATSTLLETYNTTQYGQIQVRLSRVPTPGDRWEIVLGVQCQRDRSETIDETCNRKLLQAYDGFQPHMQSRPR